MYRNISQLLILSIITISLAASNQQLSVSTAPIDTAPIHSTPLDAHIPVRDLQHIVLGYLQLGWDWALKAVIRVPNNPLLITYLLEQNHLACASKNGFIAFYDLVTHKISKTVRYDNRASALETAPNHLQPRTSPNNAMPNYMHSFTLQNQAVQSPEPHHTTQNQMHAITQLNRATQNQLHALTTLAPDYLACASSQGIKIWHITDIATIGKPVISLARRVKQASHFETSSLAYNPKQQLLASSLPSEKIQIWTLCNKKSALQQTHMRCLPGEARELAFSPDGNYLASAGLSNHAVTIWDTKTGARTQTIMLSDVPRLFVTAITSIAWLPDQRIVAGIHNNQCVWELSEINRPKKLKQISDPDPLAQVHQLLPIEHSANTVAIVNDVSKKRIAVYNLNTGLHQNIFEFHDGKINHLTLSPDGSYCAAACADQTIKIWQNTAHVLFEVYNKQDLTAKII